jgi:hypothetical protein
VTKFTRAVGIHFVRLPADSVIDPKTDFHVRPALLNLMGIITASSFHAHARFVNALTEEVADIRFCSALARPFVNGDAG